MIEDLNATLENQSIYKSVLEHMLDEVHIWELIRDSEGNIRTWKLVDANPAALKAWNKSLEDIQGKTTDEIFPGANATESFMPIVEKIFQENQPHQWESYFPGTDQTLFMKSIPMGDYFVSTGIDISNLKQTQSALHDSHLRLSESVKAGRVAIWDWDIKNDSMNWDDLMYQIYGVERGQSESVAIWQNALHPNDKKMAFNAIEDALNDVKQYRLEFRIVRPSGEVRHIKGDGTVIRDENGTPIRMLGTNIDITNTRAAEAELKETVLRLNESVKAGNIGIWDWDLISNGVTFSREYKAHLGYKEEEFKNEFNEWEKRVHPDDLPRVLEKVQQSVEMRSTSHEDEFRLKHRDGSYRWILSHASVVTDQNQVPIRMIGSHVDITERKNLEEELRQSQKMEAIGHLAGGIAHDFNNQLASIMGFSELLERKLDDPKLLKYVRKITSAAEHSGNLTNQLLTFSRKQNLNIENIDLHFQLHEVIDLLKRSVDKRIILKSYFNAPAATIKGDKSIIQNAFLNLGLNARDAMPEGGTFTLITENIESVNEDNEKLSSIRINVKDTGCGIPADIQPQIFDPFFTTKEVGKGTGMGLASVYGAIKQLGGNISVESEVGVGSCFSIEFPLSEPKQMAKVDNLQTQDSKQTGKHRILLVDDEKLLKEVCSDFFQALGHNGVFAENGEDAINLYKEQWQNIDLIILDMIMPSMNGKDVFLELIKINPDAKVIIASGYTADNSLADMLKLGAVDTLKKPFRLASLKAHIDKYCNT